MKLQIDIFEGRSTKPILRHVFFGTSREAAFQVLRAHKQTDSFLRAALTTGRFRGMTLKVRTKWLER